MATEVQQQVTFEPSDQSTLDGILRHHLSLDPQQQGNEDNTEKLNRSWNASNTDPNNSYHTTTLQQSLSQASTATRKGGSRQFSRPSVHQSTHESDNKRRPIVLKRNASRYKSPSPEPPDPNSEAKSVTIRRMQSNLEEWDKQLEEISTKKVQNETIQHAEITKRDNQIKDFTDKYSNECELRARVEGERDDLTQRLANTEDELAAMREQVEQLQSDLSQYEAVYEEVNARRIELEEDLAGTNEQLQQSETMRRRLNDHVTELQGQLAIEEQRSRFCSIM